jgi:hypothetical protein
VRWKLSLTLPSGWKRSVDRLSDPKFHYLRLGVVSAAVVVAAFFSAPGRPDKPGKAEPPKAVAFTPPPQPLFNALPSDKRALFDPAPSATLRHAPAGAIPAPETPDPAVQIDVRRVLKLMNAGVIKYASDQDEANKVKGAKLIQIAALLGYQTARNLLVLNYPRAASVRAAVTAPDVILYAIDLFLAKRPEAVTEFVTLANYFSTRGEITKFAKVVVDVVRDDARLGDAEQIDNLFKALSSVRGVCSAIKHLVLSDPAIGENDCSDTVQAGLLAEAKGSNGLEREARDRGIELMRRTDAAP